MPTSGYLSQSLRRPLPTKDDGILRTVADAAGYMMALSKDRQRAHWQRAARLLLDEAHAHDLSRQVELALFYDRQLDLRSSRLHQERVLQCMREKRLTVDAATSSKRRSASFCDVCYRAAQPVSGPPHVVVGGSTCAITGPGQYLSKMTSKKRSTA